MSQQDAIDDGDRLARDEITARDYFAAKALQGLIAGADSRDDWNTAQIANWTYRMADAMLKERAK